MSRLNLAHPAIRPADPGRVLISGPPGSGRTESALIVATVLADGGRVLVIDTDHPSSLDYADRYAFDVVAWTPPHDPAAVAETIGDAGQVYAAIVIDSTTDQWFGRGGVRELADDAGWITARAAHAELLETIRESPAHVVGTCDTLVAYVVDEENRVLRVGTEPRHDVGIESRWQVALTLDAAHGLTLVNGPGSALGATSWAPGEAAEFARAYAEWIAQGEPRADRVFVDDLLDRLRVLPDQARREAKNQLAHLVGSDPHRLLVSQYDDAERIVASFEPDPDPEPEDVAADVHPADAAEGEEAA